MTIQTLIDRLPTECADHLLHSVSEGTHPHVLLKPEGLTAVCACLKTDPHLRFDLLRCISAVDRPAENAIELSYELLSIPFARSAALKVRLDRTRPEIDSVSAIWPAANWHEREAYDLMGVHFRNHPDLRRILMPDDWVGHPLRKDYRDPVEYRGLRVKP